MLRRKLAESLTVRIFLLTFLLLLGAGGLTFALIAWATPITYTAVISDRLQAQVADLTQQLAQTNLADAGPILDAFVRESGAEVALTAPGGAEADTGSLLVLPEEDWQVAVTMSGADNSVQTYEADTYQVQIDRADGVVTATQTGILTTQITFADQEGTYQLLVSPQLRLANQAVEALGRVAPWLALALLAFSLLCAFGYSRYITRPIVRLNGIAGRMAELDLQWVCGERRRDEIGQLGRSLDKMARRLSAALTDLETANQALRGEGAREREASPVGRAILEDLRENFTFAQEKRLPICQDTGMAVVFCDLGQEVHITGGLLSDAVNEGVSRGYTEGFLRCSVVEDPLRRVNTGDNTPAILHLRLVEGDGLDLTVAPKGFGSENMTALKMFTPSVTREGVEDYIVSAVSAAGSNPCPPVIVGVCVGGSMDKAALLAKKATIRGVGTCHPDPRYAGLEREALKRVNASGIGPGGLGGRTTALAVNIEYFPTHIASIPVAVNL